MTEQEILDALVVQRGITNLEAFAAADYEEFSHDPFLMNDMQAAVDRIVAAHKAREKVAVYGDYDVDGLTATTVLLDAFDSFDIEATHFIPDRFVDGYGLSNRGVDVLAEEDVSLIITVDTGSLAHEQIEYAKSKNIDVIVTDHHTPKGELPVCVGVLNPKREDSTYPFADLAGVGVAFKLVQALMTKLDGMPAGQEKWLLDLVALGTVCDVVSLVDENRSVVKWGIEVMKKTRRPGLSALLDISDTDTQAIDTTVFGFRLGPRLNASGRVENAEKSLQVLRSKSLDEARQIATELDKHNTNRRVQQRSIYEEAHQVAQGLDDNVLVVTGEGWNHGVVGIVASRIVEEFGKPTFVLSEQQGVFKGSARSFGDFHLAKAIEYSEEFIEKGGGHAAAAGVTIKSENIESFTLKINEYYNSLKLKDQHRYLEKQADLTLEDFSGLTLKLVDLLESLAPFGEGNQKPIFEIRCRLQSWRGVGQDKRHAKMTLEDSSGIQIDGIGFGLSENMPEAGSSIKLICSVERNEWNGRQSLQLSVGSVK